MGEIATVDVGRLRRLADRVSVAAAEVAEVGWPELEPDALPGSAVSAILSSRPGVDQIRAVSTSLGDWATTARASADAFERADTANGERFSSG